MNRSIMNAIRYVLVLMLSVTACKKPANNNVITGPPDTRTFTNPLLPSGPDPWVFQQGNYYYYTQTFGNRLALLKTEKMSELSKAQPVTVWTPPPSRPYSQNIWAPEITFLRGKWYAYLAADDGNNANHRIYVLENASPDPLAGSWELKGKIADSTDKWAIDANVFEYSGKLYMVWSGWPGDVNVEQVIYIAGLKDPLTIEGPRVLLSSPTFSWERAGALPAVNEGPEGIVHNDRLFLTYSASGCWTDSYAIGLLTLKQGGDPMKASDWTKSPSPIFVSNATNNAYGPGHNGFFKSKDGKEDWIIYHANPAAGLGCRDARNPRIQKFTWNADGSPNFGEPVNTYTRIVKPSGE